MYQDHRWKSSPSRWSSATCSVHSVEEPASKWHTWANEEDKQRKPLSHSPKISHTPHKSPKPPTAAVEQRKFTFQSHQDPFLLVTSDPPVCFCKKPAHRSYTLEYGMILECASYDTVIVEGGDKIQSIKSKYTCGFHVHARSWLRIRQAFLKGQPIDAEYSELTSCPLYNFTYCSIFYVTNKFDKLPPLVLPQCFCGKPVILRETKHAYSEHRPRYFFTCKNSTIEGAKKCSWRLEANEVAFPRPKNRIHDRVSAEEYQKYFQQQQQPQRTKQHHQSELLATLTATSDVIDFESLKEKLSSSTSSLVIPTSVLAKKQQQPPPPSVSSSTTTTTSSSITSPKSEGSDVDDLKRQIARLTKRLDQALKETQHANEEAEHALDKVTQIEMDSKEEISIMNLDLREETILRENCQNKLAHNEIELVNLKMDHEKLAEEFSSFREETRLKYGKEEERNKCKVCFHRSIECVLIPCFHYAYCHSCAIKLKECAICRREFYDIQKIYTC